MFRVLNEGVCTISIKTGERPARASLVFRACVSTLSPKRMPGRSHHDDLGLSITLRQNN
jgi:hypothetical protein